MEDFLLGLASDDRAEVLVALVDVRRQGLRAARHLRGPSDEVRATGLVGVYRILFATEGHRQQVLLALEGFTKQTQRTPPATLGGRLRWRQDRLLLRQAELATQSGVPVVTISRIETGWSGLPRTRRPSDTCQPRSASLRSGCTTARWTAPRSPATGVPEPPPALPAVARASESRQGGALRAG